MSVEATIVTNIIIFQDYYNFDHLGKLNPKSLINDGAHKLQKAGILTPYEWSADINTDVDLRE